MKSRIGCACGMVAIAVHILGAGPATAQQNYPTKPVRYVVPYPPGGSTDPMARMVAARLTERWGQTVLVDNRPGGSTVIGMDYIAKAAPDGYTIGWAGAAMFSTPHLIPNMPYDPIRDLTGVATLARSRVVLVLHPSVPVRNLKEMIAFAKARPGQLNFASSGMGTNTHLSGELFNMMAGTQLTHIPYKGSGPATTDLLGGRVEMSFQIPITVIPMIKAGKLRPIAVTGNTRLAAIPDVPTFTEAGLPGYGLTGITAVVAPIKTPRALVERINADIAAVLATAIAQDYIAKQGAEPFTSNVDETNAIIKQELARYGSIIKTAGVKLPH